MHIGFWGKNQTERDHDEHLDVGRGEYVKLNFRETG
jgi:hypothetical protein